MLMFCKGGGCFSTFHFKGQDLFQLIFSIYQKVLVT